MLARGIGEKALLGGSCCTAGSTVEWDQETMMMIIIIIIIMEGRIVGVFCYNGFQ